jgi:hypothetical protein
MPSMIPGEGGMIELGIMPSVDHENVELTLASSRTGERVSIVLGEQSVNDLVMELEILARMIAGRDRGRRHR